MKGIILTALFLPSLAIAQQTETRTIADFDEIVVTSTSAVEVNIGNQYEVIVEALDGELVDLITRLDGDALVIEQNEGGDYLIRISLPKLEALALVGAGDVSIGEVQGEELELAVASSGSVTVGNLSFEDIEISVTGSGDLNIQSLEAEQAEIRLIGAGDLEIGSVQIEKLESRLVGSGDISASGEVEEMGLQIAGAGNFDGSGLNVGMLEGNIVGAGGANFQQVENNQLIEGESDLSGLFDVIGSFGDNAERRDEEEFDLRRDYGGSDGGVAGALGALTGIVAILLIFGGPVIVIAIILAFSYRRKKLLHETLRQYSASDQQLPDEFLEVLKLQGAKRNNLHSGMIMVAVGLGISVFFLAVGAPEAAALGCLPGFIGLAMLAIWKLEKKDEGEV